MKTPKPIYFALIFLLVTTCLVGQQPAPDSDFARGREALVAGKYQDAISAFKKSDKQNHGTCAECQMGMAVAYFRVGDKDNSLKSSDKAIQLLKDDSSRAAAHNMKAQAYLLIESDAKSLQKAEAEFREAVRLVPGQADFHLNLARALMKQSKDDEATIELKQCLASNPRRQARKLRRSFWVTRGAAEKSSLLISP